MHLLVSQNDLLRQTDLQVCHVEKAPGDVNTTTMDSDVETITVDSISLSLFVLFLSYSNSKDKLFILPIGTSSFLHFFDINGLY